MITSDIHMHSAFSSDSESSMESMIEGAIEKGVKTICFTEHLDYEYPPEDGKVIFEVDLDAYQKKIKELQDVYRKQIEVLFAHNREHVSSDSILKRDFFRSDMIFRSLPFAEFFKIIIMLSLSVDHLLEFCV